jgi:hypothetical protein
MTEFEPGSTQVSGAVSELAQAEKAREASATARRRRAFFMVGSSELRRGRLG